MRSSFAGAVTLAALVGAASGCKGSSPADGPPAPVTIYAFGGASSPANDGAEPKGTLTAATIGGRTVLFGRTAIGGAAIGCGTIFSIDPDGSNYQVLHRFGGPEGCNPRHDAMILDPDDGNFYATAQGVNQTIPSPPPPNTYGNQGQIFTFTPGTTAPISITAVHVFPDPPVTSPPDGAEQHSSFSIDPVTGMLYGQSAAGGASGDGLLYAVYPDGTGFTPLHSFSKDTGTDPHGRIVLSGGALYGIARTNGATTALPSGYGYGTVFSYTPTSPLADGPVTLLHTFTGAPDDGALSDHGYLTPVAVGGKTILFGMTQCGGTGTGKDACSASDGGGAGVIFQIDATAAPGSRAAFSIVHSFQGTEQGEGAAPYGSLMFDGRYLYGTTSAGGSFDKGTIFRVAPVPFGGSSVPQILHHLGASANDGAKPIDNVIKVGNTLYGMTVYGGASVPSPDNASVTGNGSIFAVPLPD